MNPLISVCIPTRNRPNLVTEAVLSCYAQTYAPLEILVGDDSTDGETENAVRQIAHDAAIELRYHRNKSPLGQAGNVNGLFDLVRGDRLVLLHDDDLLFPDAVRALADCWLAYPELTAAFGKQYLISTAGAIKTPESDDLNKMFFRTCDRAGLQGSAVESALLQQFPNDGFMIRSAVAKRIRLRDRSKVGDAPDFDFGIRVALDGATFYFLDRFTCKYRLTPNSVRSTAVIAEYMFPMIKDLPLPEKAEQARNYALKQLAPFYVKKLAMAKKRADALGVVFGRHFDRRLLYSPKGVILLGQILFPALDQSLRKLLKRR